MKQTKFTPPRRLIFVLTSLAWVLASPSAPAYHEFRMITEADLHRIAHFVYDEANALINGPQPATFRNYSQLSCAELYARRLKLYRKDVDTNPTFTDDPRNHAAVFIGLIYTPAFYYLPYSAIMNYRDHAHDVRRESKLDALRFASAERDCFID